jgi:hypothetical protein
MVLQLGIIHSGMVVGCRPGAPLPAAYEAASQRLRAVGLSESGGRESALAADPPELFEGFACALHPYLGNDTLLGVLAARGGFQTKATRSFDWLSCCRP